MRFLPDESLPGCQSDSVWLLEPVVGPAVIRSLDGTSFNPLRWLGMTVRVLLIVLLLCLTQMGCMHRRVTIYSDPLGALVKVDGRVIGYTPASFDFTWYGTREVQLLKDGYETQTQQLRVDAPWYQRFPLDFVSDNFAGTHIRDDRQISIRLQPRRRESSTDVIQRGRSLRSEAIHGL